MFRVLLVEDNTQFRRMLGDSLRAQMPSAEIREAGNGDIALVMVEEAPPHLVILDLGLPGMNGIALTRIIKQRFPETIVLVLTNYDSREYREAALDSGAEHFLSKATAKLSEIHSLINKERASRGPKSNHGEFS